MTNTLYGRLLGPTEFVSIDGDVMKIGLPENREDLAEVCNQIASLCRYQSDYFMVVSCSQPGTIAIQLKPGNSWDDLDNAINQD